MIWEFYCVIAPWRDGFGIEGVIEIVAEEPSIRKVAIGRFIARCKSASIALLNRELMGLF